MSKQLTFTDDACGLMITAPNGKYLGGIDCDVDGMYYFGVGNDSTATWPSWVLRQIADKLDELNKPWEDHINETLKP